MRKYLSLIVLLFTLILPFKSLAEQITNFNAEYTINKDGTVSVLEKIDYSFGAEQKHGIFRKIATTKTNTDGKKYGVTLNDVVVTDQYGAAYKFSPSSEVGYLVLKIGDPNVLVTGNKTYYVRYKLSGAITYFSDHDEFYWNVTGLETQVDTLNTETTVVLPPEIQEINTDSTCYTGRSGSTDKNCSINKEGNTIVFKTLSPLRANEGITVVVGFPKNIVSVLEPQELTKNLGFFAKVIEAIMAFLFSVIVPLLIFGWVVVYPIKIFLKYRADKINTKIKERIVAAWFEQPETLKNRSLTPAETSALVDKNVDHKDISATIIDLAQRGYLKIHTADKNRISVELVKDYDNDDKVIDFEKELLDALFSHGTVKERSVDDLVSSVDFFNHMTKFRNSVAKGLVADGLFKDNIQKTAEFYSIISVTALMTMNLILAGVALLFGKKSAAKTDLGIEKYSEAASLKNFLVSQTEQLNFQSQNQMMFEKLLPFATAFGVETIWAKRFENLKLQPTEWADGNNLNNVAQMALLSRAFNTGIKSNASAMSSTHSSSGFSSGFSGGSSGGGGGGGGTGSW